LQNVYATLYLDLERGDNLNYPNPYIQFLVHFHGDRDYFECHELLEEHWKNTEPAERDSVWVGLIQVAVSLYHYRRENLQGAKKTINKAINILSARQSRVEDLGLNHRLLIELLDDIQSNMDDNQHYTSVNLPIKDSALLTKCKQACKEKRLNWCSNSNLSNSALIHRHKLRDRSEVINNRKQSLLHKRKSRIENKD
jgi:uncharacterized protein